ncbi:hypothetical protein AK973_2344 [Pseudomonas brassicacearum]|nr:hypothetical protein AK973_2344 [Pseudomonas brassicacearum]
MEIVRHGCFSVGLDSLRVALSSTGPASRLSSLSGAVLQTFLAGGASTLMCERAIGLFRSL